MKTKQYIALLVSFFLCAIAALETVAQIVPSLINYQGKLTDASGNPLPNGTYGVAVRIWPNKSATNGEPLIWGQEYNVAVLSGIFNVILGAPGGLALTNPTPAVNDIGFAFGESNRFIAITVARGTNGLPIANASEIIPRQQVLSVPFALVANIADGAVTLPKLAPRQVATNVGVGGFAISSATTFQTSDPNTFAAVPNLRVTIKTIGRPVMAFLVSGPNGSSIGGLADCERPGIYVILRRDDSVDVAQESSTIWAYRAEGRRMFVPPGAFQFFDDPPGGTHTYSILIKPIDCDGPATTASVSNIRLVVYEL